MLVKEWSVDCAYLLAPSIRTSKMLFTYASMGCSSRTSKASNALANFAVSSDGVVIVLVATGGRDGGFAAATDGREVLVACWRSFLF